MEGKALKPSVDAAAAAAPFVKPKFGALALVCSECEDRGSGPAKLKGKQLRKILKGQLHNLPVRTRVLSCGCLGLCPKKAIAVALLADGLLQAAEIRSTDEAAAVAASVAERLR